MKNKNGFTLIEILGTIIIMSVIIGVLVPTLSNITGKEKERAYENQKKLLLSKAKDWVLANNKEVKENLRYVPLSKFKVDKIIDNDIKDPRNNQIMNGCVEIRWDSQTSQYVYSYLEATCEDMQAQHGPKFTFDGNEIENGKVINLEVGEAYQLPLVKAISKITNQEINVTGPNIVDVTNNENANGPIIDNVNSSFVDSKFKLSYFAYDPAMQYTYTRYYYVQIVDTKGPVINYGTLQGSEKTGNAPQTIYVKKDITKTSYNVMNMKVTDNSCFEGIESKAYNHNACPTILVATPDKHTISLANPGEISVVYTAKDKKNNETTYTLKYVVSELEFVCTDLNGCTHKITYPGWYQLNGFGAQGGGGGGQGGYIAGKTYLNIGDIIQFEIGKVSGGGTAGNDGQAGGSATIISKNNNKLLIAAGGGANGTTPGTPGGSGTGEGAPKPNNCGQAGGNGINGSGGGSNSNCTYEATETYQCQSYNPNKKCTRYIENCSSNSSTASCAVCLQAFSQPSHCDGFYHHNDPGGGEGYWCYGCNPYTQTYDCPGMDTWTCTRKVTKTSQGKGGVGGTSLLSEGVTLIEKIDGNQTGNGKGLLKWIGE